MVFVATELTQVLQALLMAVEIITAGTMTSFSGNVLERRQQAVVEFLAWADHPAQVQSHPDCLINAALWSSDWCVLAAVFMPSNCTTVPWLS